MNQSSYIAAVLLAGFVLFLAAKGRLTAYTAVLWGPSAGSGQAIKTQTSASASPGGNNMALAAKNILGFVIGGF